jgi:hypothetical protein
MMKLKTLIVLMILTSLCHVIGQEKQWSPSDYKDLSFKEFVVSAQAILKVKIFYKDEWVKELKLGAYPEKYSLSDLLTELLRGTSLYFYFDKRGNIILTKNFAIKVSDNLNDDETIFIPPTDYSAPEDDQQITGNTLVEIGNPADRNKGGKVIISGYITDSETKEPLAGTTILSQKHMAGAVSNDFGFYTLELPRGINTLQFSFLGMKEKLINLNLFGNGELNMEMKSTLIPLKEAVISAQKGMILQRFEVGVEKINLTSFRLLPTSLGESDIVKSILLIPGVKSVGEGSAGFNVRGGSADQNLILLYGAPVYNASHFFGFFSAVNSEIIKDATLYKGGIPARYGGRISSVLDIGSIDGNPEEFHGTAGISPVTTQLMLEGPIIKDTLTYIFSARTTYSDWIFNLMKDPTLRESKASFYDLNLKITYDVNKFNKLEFASYLSHDSFRFGSDSLYRYNNNIFSLKWRHIFSSRFFSSFNLNNSFYEYDVSSYKHKPESFILSHSINSTDFKADFNWFHGRNEINFGLDLRRYSVLPGSYIPAGDSSLVAPNYIDKEKAYEGSMYFEDKFKVTNYLSVNTGVRLSSYFAVGPGTVYVYSPGFSKSSSTITDTLNFSQGEVSKIYGGPEIRISLNFRTSGTNSVKVNYNRTRQYLHLLSNTTSISPTDTWKLCDYNVKPQIGDQIGIGFYQIFSNNSIEASAEIYYKKIKNMIDFKGGANLLMNENIEQDVVNVEGKAYGLELLLKKTQGKLLFSLGYTYSGTFIRSLSTLKEEVINDGNWFPSNFDKPSDLVITLNYLFSRRFSFSTNYTWSTGRPVTYPVATYNIYDELLVHYSDRNKYRIPEYSRLDLSFNIAGSLRLHKLANPNWTFSVYNLFGRNNVYSVYFQREGDEIKGYQLSVFASAVPSVTFSFDF